MGLFITLYVTIFPGLEILCVFQDLDIETSQFDLLFK